MKVERTQSNPRGDDFEVRKLVSRAIHKCPRTRQQIAEQMTAMLNRRVNVSMLNDYSAESKRNYRFPMAFVRAFCASTGDWSLLEMLARRAGFRLIGPDEERLIAIGRAYEQKAKAEKFLKEVEL